MFGVKGHSSGVSHSGNCCHAQTFSPHLLTQVFITQQRETRSALSSLFSVTIVSSSLPRRQRGGAEEEAEAAASL